MVESRDLVQRQRELVSKTNDLLDTYRKAEQRARADRDEARKRTDSIVGSISDLVRGAETMLKESGWWGRCSDVRGRPESRDRSLTLRASLETAQEESQGLYQELCKQLLKPGAAAGTYRRPSSPFGWALMCGFGVFLTIVIASGTMAAAAVVGLVTGLGVLMLSAAPAPRSRSIYEDLLSVHLEAQKTQRLAHKEADKAYEAATQKDNDALHEALEGSLRPAVAEFSAAVKNLSPDWDSPKWSEWKPSDSLPEVARIGYLRESITSLQIPAILPALRGRSLVIKANTATKATAVAGVQSVVARLLASTPPAKLRLTIIDPLALGQSVSPFMALADYDDSLVTGKAWTEPSHIEQRLANLTEHMENVIQKYLRNDFATIEEYNEQAGRMAEAFRLLLVFDFPTNLSDTAIRRLISILKNGPRCGVFSIVVVDTNIKPPYGFNEAELEQNCELISSDNEVSEFGWKGDEYDYWAFEWEPSPLEKSLDAIIDAIGEEAVEGKRVEVPFGEICPDPAERWTASAKEGIAIALGPAGARKVQQLKLGEGTAQHVLVAGKTGSGKSTLLHTIITGIGLAYSPEELQVYLVDFKKGVEFKCYATEELPHARVIAIESEREFGLSVLQGLDNELKVRGELFRKEGVDHISAYRDQTGQAMPRIMLIVDEFHEFFTEDDQIASIASQILDRLVRQGRAFGLHVLLGSQTLAGAYNLARSTVDQMAVRIALQCSEADSRLILADDNPAARLLSRPGEAVYNATNGLVEGNNIFQVAWLGDDERNDYLRQIRSIAQVEDYAAAYVPIVFEGNAPASAERNLELAEILTNLRWQEGASSVRAWLGEPVTIAGHVAAQIRRQSGGNLLIVGQREELAVGMLGHALVALAAQLKPGRGHQYFYVFDFSLVDASHAGTLREVVERLPQAGGLCARRDLVDIVREIAGEVDRRLADPDQPYRSVFLLIHGLQRARDLRADEDAGFGLMREAGDEEPVSKLFAKILRDGPELGVHTLVWCDTMANLNRSTDRRAVREFATRVAFQMSAEDSSSIIDTPAASRLGQFRALILDENEGRLEKFRPYGLPSADWLAEIGRRLSHAREAHGADSQAQPQDHPRLNELPPDQGPPLAPPPPA